MAPQLFITPSTIEKIKPSEIIRVIIINYGGQLVLDDVSQSISSFNKVCFQNGRLDSKLAITSRVCLIIKFLHYDVDTERCRLWHTWQYPARRYSSRGYKHSDSAFVSVK